MKNLNLKKALFACILTSLCGNATSFASQPAEPAKLSSILFKIGAITTIASFGVGLATVKYMRTNRNIPNRDHRVKAARSTHRVSLYTFFGGLTACTASFGYWLAGK